MTEVTLDWSSAQVRDGRLEVALAGERPKGWTDAFERTVTLLAGHQWGSVSLKKGRVSVERVAEGDEERLRHFLESAVLEANAATGQTGAGDEEPAAGDAAEGTRDGDPDAQLTERFRAFAADEDDGGDGGGG